MEFTAIEEMIRNRVSGTRKWSFIITAVAIVAMGLLFFFKYLEVMPISNIEDFISERSKRHPFVRLENAVLYNSYYTLTETQTENGRETSRKNFSYFLYIDPIDEEEYRMFLVELRGVVNTEYFVDRTIEGEMKSLSKTDKEVVAGIIEDYGLDEEDIIVTGMVRQANEPQVTGWVLFIIAGVAGIIFLIMALASTLTYTKPGNVAALRNARSQYGNIVHNMESAARSGREVYSDSQLLIAEGGIFGRSNKWIFMPMQGLMLVAITKITHRTNGVKTGTSVVADLYYSDKKTKRLTLGAKEPDNIYYSLVTKCPDVLVDFDKDLIKLFKKNFEQFRVEVADRLRAQSARLREAQEQQ